MIPLLPLVLFGGGLWGLNKYTQSKRAAATLPLEGEPTPTPGKEAQSEPMPDSVAPDYASHTTVGGRVFPTETRSTRQVTNIADDMTDTRAGDSAMNSQAKPVYFSAVTPVYDLGSPDVKAVAPAADAVQQELDKAFEGYPHVGDQDYSGTHVWNGTAWIPL